MSDLDWDPFPDLGPHDRGPITGSNHEHCRLCGDYLITDPCPAPVATFTNGNDIPWTVALVLPGTDESLAFQREFGVRFYDRRYTVSFHPLFGQFVSSYYVSTLLETRAGQEIRGLNLNMGIPAWSIDPATMTNVREWAESWTHALA